MKNTKYSHEYASDQEVKYTISEEWKPIKGYEGLYAVSSKGKVMNLKSGRILKNGIDGHGYAMVTLYRGDGTKQKKIKVHRLVAEAFIENPLNLPQVNHINEDKTNNNVENLAWVSASQNTRYSAHKYSCRINQLSLDGELVNTWDSSMQIKRDLGYSNGSIIDCCKGKHKQVYGFRWEYADQSQRRKYNRPVAALTMDGDLICEYKSAAEAARCLKIGVRSIRLCLNGKYKSTNGLQFIYID